LSLQLDAIKLAVQTCCVLTLEFVPLGPFISFEVIKMETQGRKQVQINGKGKIMGFDVI
jgi:hypothetical protein